MELDGHHRAVIATMAVLITTNAPQTAWRNILIDGERAWRELFEAGYIVRKSDGFYVLGPPGLRELARMHAAMGDPPPES